MQNMQVATDAYPVGGDSRKDLARECGVRGAFAIWRDGAVWEFGGAPPMENKPEELIKGAADELQHLPDKVKDDVRDSVLHVVDSLPPALSATSCKSASCAAPSACAGAGPPGASQPWPARTHT